jgi:hypothetical protein
MFTKPIDLIFHSLLEVMKIYPLLKNLLKEILGKNSIFIYKGFLFPIHASDFDVPLPYYS